MLFVILLGRARHILKWYLTLGHDRPNRTICDSVTDGHPGIWGGIITAVKLSV